MLGGATDLFKIEISNKGSQREIRNANTWEKKMKFLNSSFSVWLNLIIL